MKRKIFALLMTVTALFTLFCGPASAQDSISVTGSASTEVAPDMATLYGSLEKKGPTAAEARERLAQQMAAVKRVFLVQMIRDEDIKTTHYSLQPEYTYEKNKQRLVGYVAQAEYKVRIKNLDKLSDVLDKSIGAGLSIDRIDFGLNNRSLIENSLLDDAVTNAKTQAAVVARAGGRVLGTLIQANLGRVNTSSRMQQPQLMMAKEANGAGMETATQLDPGVLTVRAEVSLVFGLQ